MIPMLPGFYPSRGGQLGPLGRFVLTTLTMTLALGLYFIISLGQSGPATTVTMPSWVPFWPVFALPYFGMLLVAWVLPVAIRDATKFRACLRAMICAFFLVSPLWLLIPTRLHRPPTPEGWEAGLYRLLATIDPPHCVMPCAHGIGAMVGAWYVGLERPAWRWPLVVMLAVGVPSIALVGQHRPIDILLGTIAVAIGVAVGEMLGRRERPPLIKQERPLPVKSTRVADSEG